MGYLILESFLWAVKCSTSAMILYVISSNANTVGVRKIGRWKGINEKPYTLIMEYSFFKN